MTGLENILQKIINDANEKANEIIDEARVQAARISENADNDIAKNQKDMNEEALVNADLKAKRIISAAHLEGKKQLLAKKQEIISMVFSNAVSELARLGDSEYDDLIRKMSSGISGEIVELPRNKNTGTGGGFIAKDGKVEYNYSFEALAKNAKERLENDIVKMMFE